MISELQFTCIYILLIPSIGLLLVVITKGKGKSERENRCYNGDWNDIISNENSNNIIITIIVIIIISIIVNVINFYYCCYYGKFWLEMLRAFRFLLLNIFAVYILIKLGSTLL